MAPRKKYDERILVGNCLDTLKTLDDASISSIVTDPPYELGFMGKTWDASGIAYNVELWRECLRVLKPGGHLLAFGGTRTYHRMAVAIEDAGFEIRDSIHWVYGSGFPKSLDVSKAIDKQRHDRDDIYKVTAWIRSARDAAGVTNKDIDNAFGFAGMSGHWTSSKSQPAVPTLDQVPQLLQVLGVAAEKVPEDIRRLLWDLNGKKGQPGENWAKREVTGQHEAHVFGAWVTNCGMEHHNTGKEKRDVPATDAAKTWQGWGTALKPAHEPIVVARKPLVGTVAANVLAHGTGALNIDGCRIESEARPVMARTAENKRQSMGGGPTTGATSTGEMHTAGRWPANIIFDEAAGAELDAQSGLEASRFFYCPKPGKKERNAGGTNTHPTVKPLALMRYLVRLVTPPGGIVLDPFLGSGTTAMAATLEGFDWRGCELTTDYLPIIDGRVKWAAKEHKREQPKLPFNEAS
jgi:DNA modification methylase